MKQRTQEHESEKSGFIFKAAKLPARSTGSKQTVKPDGDFNTLTNQNRLQLSLKVYQLPSENLQNSIWEDGPEVETQIHSISGENFGLSQIIKSLHVES